VFVCLLELCVLHIRSNKGVLVSGYREDLLARPLIGDECNQYERRQKGEKEFFIAYSLLQTFYTYLRISRRFVYCLRLRLLLVLSCASFLVHPNLLEWLVVSPVSNNGATQVVSDQVTGGVTSGRGRVQ